MTLTPVSNISAVVACSSNSGRQAVNRHALFVLHRAKLVHGLADHVHHAAERASAHGHRNRSALVDGLHPAHHAVGGFHGDAAHAAFAQVLLHFENDVDGAGHIEAVAHHAATPDRWEAGGFRELHVHRGACDLNDVSYIFCHKFQLSAVSS